MSTDPAIQERRASASVLCAMLNDVARTLKADERYVFSRPECVVITEDEGDIDTKISQILGTLGLCVTVMFLKAAAASKTLPGPRFDNAAIIAEISELSITNRAEGGLQITALEAAEQAAIILHQARMPSGRMLLVTDVMKYPQMPEPADNCYHVIITTGEVTLRRKE